MFTATGPRNGSKTRFGASCWRYAVKSNKILKLLKENSADPRRLNSAGKEIRMKNYTIKKGITNGAPVFILCALKCDTGFIFTTMEAAVKFAQAFGLDVSTAELCELAKKL